MSTKTPPLFGDAIIIAGTVIGVGMLANPAATSGVWFVGSLIVLLYTWFSILSSGLTILEVSTHYPHGASFDTTIKDLLGPIWNVINSVAVAFVLYLPTYAYILAGGDLTVKGLGGAVGSDASLTVGRLVFFGIPAFCIWASARLVDRFTSVLIGGMVLTFIWATGGLIADAKLFVLFDIQAPAGTSYWIYVATVLPVCLVSFGSHDNVSNLLKYFKNDAPRVTKFLWAGTLVVLVIYVLWQIAIQGNLPRNEFAPVIAAEGQVSVLIEILSKFAQTGSTGRMLTLFSCMAITTSFLGVTLGLFDYITDIFKWSDSVSDRVKTAALTFLPPLISCLLFPTGFVTAISYVGLVTTIWTGIIPAMLLYRSHKKFDTGKNYKVYGGFGLMVWVFLFDVVNIATQVLSQLEPAPVFKG